MPNKDKQEGGMYEDYDDDDWQMEAAENEPASPKQLAFLKRLGHPGPWNLTLYEASELIQTYIDFREQGLGKPDPKDVLDAIRPQKKSWGGGGGKKKKAAKKTGCLVSFFSSAFRIAKLVLILLGLLVIVAFIVAISHH